VAKKGGNTVGSKQNFDLKVMRGSGFGCHTLRGGVVNPGGSGGGTPVEIDHCYVEAIETFSPPKPAVLGSVLEELQLTAQGVGQIVMTNETYS
jgi:hypothetical protein